VNEWLKRKINYERDPANCGRINFDTINAAVNIQFTLISSGGKDSKTGPSFKLHLRFM
jgi:hypothetical protein